MREKFFLPNFYNVMLSWLWGLPGIALIVLGLIFPPPSSPVDKTKPIADNQVKASWIFHWWLVACVFYYFIGARELVKNPWNFHIFNPVAAAFAGRTLVLLFTLAKTTTNSKTWFPALQLSVIIGLTGLFSFINLKVSLYSSRKAYSSYQLGLALRQISKPQDLVVTIPEDIGDPVAIFNSKKRGWVFPPAKRWAPSKLPANDEESIRHLENLRAQSADWFGIVATHYNDIQKNHPRLAQHIMQTCRLVAQTDAYVIFKINEQEKLVSKPIP
jgi:hypothetical protein